MIIGYARVSTADQSLDLQMDALNKAGCERIYTEKASGGKDDRIELARVLDTLREGDTLVVYKLDRLARSTKKLIEVADLLDELGAELVSINDNMDTKTPIGKAMFRMIGVIAELERDMIRERTKAGLEAARARGRKGGRPKTDARKLDHAVRLYEAKSHSVREITELTGVSKGSLYRELDRRKEGAQ
ncbi:resolvase serine resolvase family [Alkalihalophilus pseudofirmus OF4]|uniref:Resolvase serine resolvase family n=1 Tax=Alkalihalophilus pseudofirmus (strain ATCC BAA-2126 / JCM 17055 / OF4) TaxID=398511 RepID=D3FXW1_ALKPO|nr:recombinase family protein [Alkalihalophilus pseudofirmus]ADC48948.1 resolvase serine resolvase family [Alkalihalophilus pseudofirmus OF4]